MGSIAADHDTPGAGLFEALGFVVTEQRPIVVACADEGIPGNFLGDEVAWDLLAGAIALAPEGHPDACSRLRLGFAEDFADVDVVDRPELDAAAAGNPQVGMLDLIDAVGREALGLVRLDRGAGRGYAAELRPRAS